MSRQADRASGDQIAGFYRSGDHRASPADETTTYVTPDLLTVLAPDGQGGVDDWCNYFYPTDPIGGPVAMDLSRADGKRVDQDLLDPAQCWYVYGQPKPAPQGHSGYWADPRVWAMVDRMAATGPRIPIGSGTH